MNDLIDCVEQLRQELSEERRRLNAALADKAELQREITNLRMALHAVLLDGSEECRRKASLVLMGRHVTSMVARLNLP